VPPIARDAHKGTRGSVVVVGGAPGMAGAAVLAAAAALRSGAGMVRAVVAPESVAAVQHALPAAMRGPVARRRRRSRGPIDDWADVVLLGPGLGRSDAAAALCDGLLRAWRGPVVLDADALNHFAGRADALLPLLAGRRALLTPHPLECARLAGTTVDDVLRRASTWAASSPAGPARPCSSRGCRRSCRTRAGPRSWRRAPRRSPRRAAATC
jgi:NAD(P)H-hydrate epimerase